MGPDHRHAPRAAPAQGQVLEGFGLAGPHRTPGRLLLHVGDPKVRDDGSQEHADAEDDQDGAVPFRLVVPGGRRAELVIGRKDLDQDRTQFPRGGADAVASGSVPRREQLGGDDVRGRVGTCVGGKKRRYSENQNMSKVAKKITKRERRNRVVMDVLSKVQKLTKIKGDLPNDIQRDGQSPFLVDRDEDGTQGDEECRQGQEPILL